jgi:Nucleotide modification associated domain 3
MRPYRQVYLVNVGVNYSHTLRSPIFPDKRFEFIPIHEEVHISECLQTTIQPITYDHLHCYNTSRKLLSLFPEKLQNQYKHHIVHYDPNLNNPNDGSHAAFTYGDVPYCNVRAASLKHAQPGDLLFFLANLASFDDHKGQFNPGQRSFYLIGFIEIELVLEYSYQADRGLLRNPYSQESYDLLQFAKNAHVNRLLTLPHKYEKQPFTIFEGSNRSQRFQYAVQITKQMCDICLRDKNGQPFDYSKFQSLDACIGAYTRSVRPHFTLRHQTDKTHFYIFLRYITQLNDISIPS